MMINHVLLEVFCTKDFDKNASEPYPPFCTTKGECATYQCLFNTCKFVDFTSCEDTLCYIGRASDEVFGISYGGDMEDGDTNIGIEEWEKIAIAKINEAYREFMKRKNSHE